MRCSREVLSIVRGLAALLAIALLAVPASGRQQFLHHVGGTQPGDQLGWACARAGDVNGDGFADFMAGGFPSDRNGPNSGLVVVYSGRDGAELYTYVGEQVDAMLGFSVSDAGDVNADGYDDFVMGAPGEDVQVGPYLRQNAGTADVRSGFDGSRLFRFKGQNDGVELGYRVSGAGDVNADGYADLAISSGDGPVWIRSGRNGQLLYYYPGEPTIGTAVSGAGDVNADGFDDIVGGNWGYQSRKGVVRVFSGQDGQEIYRWVGAKDNDYLGFSVADAGDVNADGFADVVAGEPPIWPGDPGGMARVFSGADGAILQLFDQGTTSALGWSVAGAGDIDNDGHDDLITGAPVDEFEHGRAWVFSGQSGALLFQLDGAGAIYALGESVDGAGDVDGDGYGDVMAGAGPSSFAAADGGYVVVATGAECGSIRSYAAECSGSGGFEPELALVGCLVVGNPLELSLAQGLGGANAALLISVTSQTSPLASGCLLHVGFPATIIPLGVLSGIGPGEGTWSTSASVPPLPATTLFLAALIQDGTHRIASNTLEATIAP